MMPWSTMTCMKCRADDNIVVFCLKCPLNFKFFFCVTIQLCCIHMKAACYSVIAEKDGDGDCNSDTMEASMPEPTSRCSSIPSFITSGVDNQCDIIHKSSTQTKIWVVWNFYQRVYEWARFSIQGMGKYKKYADKLVGTCQGRGTLSQRKTLTRIGSVRWNMNVDGMLTEDEVKKVATEMITKRILALAPGATASSGVVSSSALFSSTPSTILSRVDILYCSATRLHGRVMQIR